MNSIAPRKRPRPRPVVSCLRCREKKLKCDRTCPCQNCIKAGCRTECTYHTRPHADEPQGCKSKKSRSSSEVDDTNHGPSLRLGTGVVEDLQQRVARLEELLIVRSDVSNSTPVSMARTGESVQRRDSAVLALPYPGTLVVKGSRSRYHGQNSRVSLLNQFPDAREFINQCTEDAELVALAREVQSLQARSTAPIASPASLAESVGLSELQYLCSQLPPKATCDKLVTVYTTHFEKTLRVIHRPSFHRQYQHFWERSDPQPSSEVIPLLTAVLAAAASFDQGIFTPEEFSSREYLTHEATKALHAWANKIPRKNRVDLATLQVETLTIIADYLQLTPAEDIWKAIGCLVRSGMMMGLHVDLSRFSKLTFYQTECRRRLWITILELDLQISILSGMPMMVPELDLGPLTPLNLNDTDFDESTSEPPSPANAEEETDSLAQITLATSLAHRIKSMKLAQSPSSRDSFRERVEMGQRLEEYLASIPHQLRPGTQPAGASPASILSHVLLDIFVRRPLLHLLRPLIPAVTNTGPDEPLFHAIRRACLDSSLAILSYQDYFDPHYAELDTRDSTPYWNFFHSHCQNDLLWSALSLCELMRPQGQALTVPVSPKAAVDQRKSDYHVPSKATLIRLLEGTLDTFTRQSHLRGSNVKDILLLTTVIQSIRCRVPVGQRQHLMLQGAKNTMAACRQNLLSVAAQQPTTGETVGTNHPGSFEILPHLSETTIQGPSTPQLHNSEFVQMPLDPTADFDNLVSDLFSFDDGSFMWSM
ncbi:hypothetical protein PDE_02856 [Penicillium oxalicum 114-2]|uniref:Zn(2)-C6 fungal-type domain-containing protein n=1 Tax=Penicillium oxalicum (strain 114-2 / CGMCC 5302) TaxID=933388 RepID=S8B0R9_PENO1|nr:hypothetical protein PDE_02856 [Penicillium oxalicum 114-2]